MTALPIQLERSTNLSPSGSPLATKIWSVKGAPLLIGYYPQLGTYSPDAALQLCIWQSQVAILRAHLVLRASFGRTFQVGANGNASVIAIIDHPQCQCINF